MYLRKKQAFFKNNFTLKQNGITRGPGSQQVIEHEGNILSFKLKSTVI